MAEEAMMLARAIVEAQPPQHQATNVEPKLATKGATHQAPFESSEQRVGELLGEEVRGVGVSGDVVHPYLVGLNFIPCAPALERNMLLRFGGSIWIVDGVNCTTVVTCNRQRRKR